MKRLSVKIENAFLLHVLHPSVLLFIRIILMFSLLFELWNSVMALLECPAVVRRDSVWKTVRALCHAAFCGSRDLYFKRIGACFRQPSKRIYLQCSRQAEWIRPVGSLPDKKKETISHLFVFILLHMSNSLFKILLRVAYERMKVTFEMNVQFVAFSPVKKNKHEVVHSEET